MRIAGSGSMRAVGARGCSVRATCCIGVGITVAVSASIRKAMRTPTANAPDVATTHVRRRAGLSQSRTHARHHGVTERTARLERHHSSGGRIDCSIEFAFVHHCCPSRTFKRNRASRTRPRNVAAGMFNAAAISSCVKSPAAASNSASRNFGGSRRICAARRQ